jgi:hypothetical protein
LSVTPDFATAAWASNVCDGSWLRVRSYPF